MAETSQWEYRAVTAGTFWSEAKEEEMETLLNDLGQQGWEAVGVCPLANTNKIRILLKRPLTAAARRHRNWPG